MLLSWNPAGRDGSEYVLHQGCWTHAGADPSLHVDDVTIKGVVERALEGHETVLPLH